MTETKHEKFQRLASSRQERLIREIRLISNLANTKNYEYEADEIELMFGRLEEEMMNARNKFLRNLPTPKGESSST